MSEKSQLNTTDRNVSSIAGASGDVGAVEHGPNETTRCPICGKTKCTGIHYYPESEPWVGGGGGGGSSPQTTDGCDDPDCEYPHCLCGVPPPKTTDWRTFGERPSRPIMVEYYFGTLPDYDLPPYRDERRALGFFDGEDFFELGTGHAVFESWKPEEHLPTHWREAAESPK
jgi:hypothetical protein